MINIRNEIMELDALGPPPSENGVDIELLRKYETLIKAITRPVTDDEARMLVKLFGHDGCFGLASSLMHLIETAPGWPLDDCLHVHDNEWIVEMRNRCIRGGRLQLPEGEEWPQEFGRSS
jgi:hypothetical protein